MSWAAIHKYDALYEDIAGPQKWGPILFPRGAAFAFYDAEWQVYLNIDRVAAIDPVYKHLRCYLAQLFHRGLDGCELRCGIGRGFYIIDTDY